ncbi:MAG TPA: hypothetical protein VMT03_17720 [Polyangia bacterium]|nr:hypothetical protein [Polyangia bacterium]
MKRTRVLSAAALLLPLTTLSCGSSTGSGTPSVTCTNGTMVAAEANNYTFSSSIMLHPVKVKPKSDLTVDWGGVTIDFLTHPVNPKTDLNAIFLLSVNLKSSDFEMQLNDDTFSTSSINIPGPPPSYLPTNGETSKSMIGNFVTAAGYVTQSDLDTYLDGTTYTPANTTFAFAAQSGTSVGTGQIHMLQSFELDSTSSNTNVTLTNSSTTLTYKADLQDLHPTGVPSGNANLSLDWSMIQKNALGGTFTPTNIAHAIVGRYTQTPAQLENQFLDLQTIASELYQADIPYGTTLDFTTLMDSSGHSFTGIDSNGTWLVALICTTCRNPAPWYLTILEPATQPCK